MSRITPGTILLLFLAIMIGLTGAFFVRRQLARPPQAAKASSENRTTVPIASADLKPGRTITLGDIALFPMTRDQMKRRGISGTFMTRPDDIIGRILKTELPQGQPFGTSLFYPEGVGPGIEERLQPGYRAITISVAANNAVLGFVSAGSWVDVLFRSDSQQGDDLPETTVALMEMVNVLAIDRDTIEGNTSVRASSNESVAVTLAVTPEQAAKVQVVSERGSLTLALRNPADANMSTTRSPRTLDEVLQLPKRKHDMEVYRGQTLQRIQFHNDGTGLKRSSRLTQRDPATPSK